MGTFIKTVRIAILFIIVLFILSGCVTRKACQRKFPPQTWQSTEIITIQKPFIITLNREPVELIGGSEIVIQGDTLKVEPSFLETEFAYSRAWIQGMRLMHTLTQKEINVKDTVYVPEITIIEKEGQIVEVEKPLTWWQKALMWVGGIAMVVFFLGLLRRFKVF